MKLKFSNLYKNLKYRKFRKTLLLSCLKYSSYTFSICGLLFYALNILNKFLFHPNIDVRESLKQSTEIPFPAITLCSPVVFRSELVNFVQYFTYFAINSKPLPLSPSEQNFLAAKTQVCAAATYPFILQGIGNRTKFDLIELIKEGAPNFGEIFPACLNDYDLTDCENLLARRSLTNLGMCYTFNLQSYDSIFKPGIHSDYDIYKENGDRIIENWTLENGYSKTEMDPKYSFPVRAHTSRGFEFYMMVNHSDMHDLCYLHRSSFRVFFHLPSEMPIYLHLEDFINLNKQIRIRMSATITKADESMRKYSPEQRGCYFQGERKLQFFKTYTKTHCNFECLTNYTLKECGCVHFSYPRNSSVRICDVHELRCQMEAYKNWPEFNETSTKSPLPCECLPPCNDIEYSIESRQMFELPENGSLILKYLRENKTL